MDPVTIKSFLEYGLIAALFVALSIYTIKHSERLEERADARWKEMNLKNDEREAKYQETIKQLGQTIGITVCDSNKVAKDVHIVCQTIRDNLMTINGELDKVKTGVFDVKETVGDIQLTLAKGK